MDSNTWLHGNIGDNIHCIGMQRERNYISLSVHLNIFLVVAELQNSVCLVLTKCRGFKGVKKGLLPPSLPFNFTLTPLVPSFESPQFMVKFSAQFQNISALHTSHNGKDFLKVTS